MSDPVTLQPEGALPLLSAYGIELEYMIVDRETLGVRPIADELLAAFTGGVPGDFEDGPVAWSNELVLHVIELKTNGPTPALAGWATAFQRDVVRIDAQLAEHGAMLLPGAMHPTMDPKTETRLWPHEYSEVYSTYHRIFDCHRHGWANLQSCHVNLPFDGDAEFERLHAAIRVVLPLLPALAASSPVRDGRLSDSLDGRLEVYVTHQARIPEAMGLVVPEVVRTRVDYEGRIFAPLRAAAARLDPAGVLKHEFLNARGAIARFQRNAIEIRVLDVQECPRADLAIALLGTALVRALADARWVPVADLHEIPTEGLARVLRDVLQGAEGAVVDQPALLAALGRSGPLSAGDLWRELAAEVRTDDGDWAELGPTVDALLDAGTLASRLRAALGAAPARSRIDAVYARLAGALAQGELFVP